MPDKPLGYNVAHLDDEDGDVLEWLTPPPENHLPLYTRSEAIEQRGDRDPDWWRLVSIWPVHEGDADG